jgi:general secretion pathway protein C
MLTLSRSRLGSRAITLVVWALAAGSVAYWGLRLSSGRSLSAAAPVPAAAPAVDPMVVARVLGATHAVAEAAPKAGPANRFVLQGVVAGAPGGGAALIAVDGKPARPYRVGSVIEEGLVLQSVAARRATLAATREGPALVTLDMPPLNNK